MDLAINNVTDLCNFVGKMACVCVCVCVVWVYLELLSHFLPIKINLTNILPILIKTADFKNLAWATSFATRASRKFIYLPYRASGNKSYCHTLSLFSCEASKSWCAFTRSMPLIILTSNRLKRAHIAQFGGLCDMARLNARSAAMETGWPCHKGVRCCAHDAGCLKLLDTASRVAAPTKQYLNYDINWQY